MHYVRIIQADNTYGFTTVPQKNIFKLSFSMPWIELFQNFEQSLSKSLIRALRILNLVAQIKRWKPFRSLF